MSKLKKRTERVLSFFMAIAVSFAVITAAPIQKPKAALPIALAGGLIAVVTLAAAAGIDFAINGLMGETPTAQNNIALKVIEGIKQKAPPLINPIITNLFNDIKNKDSERVSEPDPVTGKQTYKLTKEEWDANRQAWDAYLNNPITNGELKVDYESGLEYITVDISKAYPLNHTGFDWDTDTAAAYEADCGINIVPNTSYTWYGYLDKTGSDGMGWLTFDYNESLVSTGVRRLTLNWKIWNIDGTEDSSGTNYYDKGSTIPLWDIRFLTLTGTFAYTMGPKIIVRTEHNAERYQYINLVKFMGNMSAEPINHIFKKLFVGDFDPLLANAPLENKQKDIPYSVAPGITTPQGADKVLDNWDKVGVGAIDFPIDYDNPITVPSDALPDSLKDGVTTDTIPQTGIEGTLGRILEGVQSFFDGIQSKIKEGILEATDAVNKMPDIPRLAFQLILIPILLIIFLISMILLLFRIGIFVTGLTNAPPTSIGIEENILLGINKVLNQDLGHITNNLQGVKVIDVVTIVIYILFALSVFSIAKRFDSPRGLILWSKADSDTVTTDKPKTARF